MVLQWSDGDLQGATMSSVGTSHRWQHLFRIGLGFSMGGMAALVNFIDRALIPTFLLCVLCDRGPPTILGLGSPDQGAETRAQGLLVEIN